MAQLKTTVENIELKTNRLDSSADLTQMSIWNDEKYPTTALLRNVANNINSRIVDSGSGGAASAYPIGSVIMTANDSNPGQVTFGGPLPGKWELVDKSFKTFKGNELDLLDPSTDWIKGTGIANLESGSMVRDGHMISLHLELKLTSDLSSSNLDSSTGISLGSINRESCGITTNGGRFYPLLADYNLAYAYNPSTKASFIICYTLTTSGGFIVRDILLSKNNNTLTMSSGTLIRIDAIATAHYGEMLSTACDRFYWKRTA